MLCFFPGKWRRSVSWQSRKSIRLMNSHIPVRIYWLQLCGCCSHRTLLYLITEATIFQLFTPATKTVSVSGIWPQWGCTSGQAKQNIYPLFTLITPWSRSPSSSSSSSSTRRVVLSPCSTPCSMHSHLLSPTWRPRPLSIINCRHQLQLRVFSGVGFSFCWLFSGKETRGKHRAAMKHAINLSLRL